MTYTKEEVLEFIINEDVKFIRLGFCDVVGNQKNIAIIPEELERAFNEGVNFDGSPIQGFSSAPGPDLLLFPIPSTLTTLPWRSVSGKVVRMFCEIRHGDGTPFEMDSRALLKRAAEQANRAGIAVEFGAGVEFYLFQTDERGQVTKIPFDNAGYLDVAPEDRGENIRREISLTLRQMDMHPENSHHEAGPGQNEIDFREEEPLRAADNFVNFVSVVKSAAVRNGLCADFSPLPLAKGAGNGFRINVRVDAQDGRGVRDMFMAGVLSHIREITAFLNPTPDSYKRLNSLSAAPKYIRWAKGARTELIRVPTSDSKGNRFELRSPDPTANPYLAFALIIYAGLDGIRQNMTLCGPAPEGVAPADSSGSSSLERLPETLEAAHKIAFQSTFVKSLLPEGFLSILKD